jgi:hypothetical protein
MKSECKKKEFLFKVFQIFQAFLIDKCYAYRSSHPKNDLELLLNHFSTQIIFKRQHQEKWHINLKCFSDSENKKCTKRKKIF